MVPTEAHRPTLGTRAAQWFDALRGWPWYDTLVTLRERFRADQLGLTASSLTFTTLMALVPLLTVMLALFAAFPMFATFQEALEKYFLHALVPDTIARPVLRALTQFAGKARAIGTVGLLVLVTTALSLVLTIDRTLNHIWRVRKPRPLAQRVLIYWAGMTLGPLALGVSLTVTSYAISASSGIVSALPGGVGALFAVAQFALLAAAMAGLFHFAPNAPVRWRHAWAGGVFVAVAFEIAKDALGWYLREIPTYSVIYGAFATVPVLLLWVYLGWVIVLLGAVIAAYAPSLAMKVARRPDTPGARFELALDVLGELVRCRADGSGGLTLSALSARLRTDALRIDGVLERLAMIDWVGRLDEDDEPRFALLCDPGRTPVRALVDALLLAPAAPGTPAASFRERTGLGAPTLGELLAN